MRGKLQHFVDVVLHDPAVNTVVGFTAAARASTAICSSR